MVEKTKGRKDEVITKKEKRKDEVITQEYTISSHKRLHIQEEETPNAINEIRKFAQKAKGTKDVRVDLKLTKHVSSRAICIPGHIRIRIAHKRNEDEDAKEELYSLVTSVRFRKC